MESKENIFRYYNTLVKMINTDDELEKYRATGCVKGQAYEMPLDDPSDLDFDTGPQGEVLGECSSDPELVSVDFYANGVTPGGDECLADLKILCSDKEHNFPTSSASKASNLLNDKYLNTLSAQLKSSITEVNKNPLFGSSIVLANGFTLAITACVLGLCGGLRTPTNEPKIAQAPQKGVAVLASAG